MGEKLFKFGKKKLFFTKRKSLTKSVYRNPVQETPRLELQEPRINGEFLFPEISPGNHRMRYGI